jgi:hypothetical protein
LEAAARWAQGSEYPVVIVPVSRQHWFLLDRHMLYTAVTRARSLCVLVGERRAIHMVRPHCAVPLGGAALPCGRRSTDATPVLAQKYYRLRNVGPLFH